MKKYVFTLSVVTVVIPSVAFAAWWNPLTWFKSSSQVNSSNQSPQQVSQQSSSATVSEINVMGTSSVSASSFSTTSEDALQAKIDSLTEQVNDLKSKLSSAQNQGSSPHKTAAAPQTKQNTSQTSSVQTTKQETVAKPADVSVPSQETKGDLMAKMNTLNTSINSIVSRLRNSDPIISQLGYIQGKLSSDITNLNLINYPTNTDLATYMAMYTELQSEFNALPPIIYTLGNMNYTINVIMTGYGFANATSIRMQKVNPSVSDLPIDLPIFSKDDQTINIKLSNILIPGGNYDLRVVSSSGKSSTPYPVSIYQTITPEHEEEMSISAPSSADCVTAQQKLKLAIDSQSTNLQQTYRSQVQFYCQ